MKDLSPTIGGHIEPIYHMWYSQHQATLLIDRRIEALTWDSIDGIVSELYYSIREVTIEQLEHEKDQG